MSTTSNKESRELYVDLHFTVKQLEEMLSNARVGGLVQVKVVVDVQLDGQVSEVVLR